MLQIHPNARTTPVTRAEIARSAEPTSVLARRYGVSTETIRKWRQRGVSDCHDRSARPHRLPWKASDEERAVVCALRQATNFALDDLTFVVCHFLPHLNRDSIWRILKAEGLNRRPKPVAAPAAKGQGTFKDYDLGFIHIDIYPSCRPPTVSAASASSTWLLIAARARSTSPSRTMKPSVVPSPSCARQQRLFPSASPMC